MVATLRTVGSILAGLALALVLVIAVEMVSAVVHPVPTDFGGTMEEMCRHVERYPQWFLALVVPAWAATTFASMWLAGRIGGRGSSAVVGLILLAGVVYNVAKLPYPAWFKVATLIAIPAAIYLGLRSRRKASAVNSEDQRVGL
ncbi:hypothetical protein P12x_004906 [Tundrisphaera lichenicola]|uniref:hypothetical protein n=1 Tax=Tundrisphaera lichenicola TaxID=2029860 RepID=UPI003EBE8D12